MTAQSNLAAGAAFAEATDWTSIDWEKVCREVKKLQVRIAKATREGKWGRVKSLQWLLTHSFSAKCMAVRKVTQNRGKNTPGVDGIVLKTAGERMAMTRQLKRRGYRPKPLRRVYIPKPGRKSEKRPLGIPTMKDRAMQALHTMALEPVAETTADWHSYGFRPERCTADALQQLFIVLNRKRSPVWILEGDIKGCFDNIKHSWMLDHICTDTLILEKWLKAGYIDKGKLFPTEKGTVQGGIISPVLSNMVLDGMENLLGKRYGSFKLDGHYKRTLKHGVHFVRYADDFVVTSHSQELLEKEIKPLINNFLEERGLMLSPEKTVITHLDEGFDFLGQQVRRYRSGNNRQKLLITPSKKSVLSFLRQVRSMVKSNLTCKTEALILLLNPKIRGWANYHRHVVAKATYSKVDHYVGQAIWRWARRRHPKKNKKWVKQKYYRYVKLRDWNFFALIDGPNRSKETLLLYHATQMKIMRHFKIKRDANPYDPKHDNYFGNRIAIKWATSNTGKQKIQALWRRQHGNCPVCAEPITSATGWRLNYLLPPTSGGTVKLSNLCLMHRRCQLKSKRKDFVYLLPVGNSHPDS